MPFKNSWESKGPTLPVPSPLQTKALLRDYEVVAYACLARVWSLHRMKAALGLIMTLFLRRSVKFCSLAFDGSKHGYCLNKCLKHCTKDLTQVITKGSTSIAQTRPLLYLKTDWQLLIQTFNIQPKAWKPNICHKLSTNDWKPTFRSRGTIFGACSSWWFCNPLIRPAMSSGFQPWHWAAGSL